MRIFAQNLVNGLWGSNDSKGMILLERELHALSIPSSSQ